MNEFDLIVDAGFTVKDLKEFLSKLPPGYDNCKIVTLQPTIVDVGNDKLEFTGFDDFLFHRIHADVDVVRFN